MKKLCGLIVLLCSAFMIYAEGFMDYFPVEAGTYWIYESGNGTVTDGIQAAGSATQDDGTVCHLFKTVTSFGTTSTLYGVVDNKLVKLAFRNVMGKATEYRKPYPLVLAAEGISYSFNDGDDCVSTTEKASVSFNGKTYEDCILVTEKLYVEGKVMRTQKSYYAKGIGLVYVTNISSEGKESVYKKLAECSFEK